jgi:hypothetical protein
MKCKIVQQITQENGVVCVASSARTTRVDQVSLEILMLGNLLEKSLALAAIFTATWRATAL